MQFFIKMLKPVLIIFVVINILVLFSNSVFEKFNIDRNVLLAANLLFFIVSVLVFFIQKNALQNSNPNVFVRSIISGMMLKMFSTVIAVSAYVLITGKDYNKKAVFIALLMYLVYLGAEVAAISKENKKNGKRQS
jgi:hypothetical protein